MPSTLRLRSQKEVPVTVSNGVFHGLAGQKNILVHTSFIEQAFLWQKEVWDSVLDGEPRRLMAGPCLPGRGLHPLPVPLIRDMRK